MMLVAPSARICSWASRLVPSAIASIEITAATPKTMPSTVSPDRSLCSSRLFIPSLSARQMRPIGYLVSVSVLRSDGRQLGLVPRLKSAVPLAPSSSATAVRIDRAVRCSLRIRGLGPSSMIRPSRIRMIRLAQRGDVVFVRDHDDRLARVVQLLEHLHDFVAGLGVEVTGRLVGQDDVGVVDQRAGDRDALLLAAGELRRAVIEPVAQADQPGHLDRPLLRLGADLAGALVGQRKLDVLEDRVLLDQVVRLEDEAEVAAADLGELVVVEPGDVAAAQEVLAARWGGRDIPAG